MISTDFYLPILKSKQGEFTALSHLRKEWEGAITPLFEITPLEWDQVERRVPRTIDEHLDSFCKKIIKKWPTSNCFIDSGLLKWNGSDNRHKIEYVYDKLVEKGIYSTPVMTLQYSNDFLQALQELLEKYAIEEIGIRTKVADLTAQDFQYRLDSMLNEFGIAATQCHMIIDLIDSNFTEIDNFADALAETIESFPYIGEWKSVTIAGTAFPSSRTIKEGISYFPRNDWKVYSALVKRLREREFIRAINYGDYSIVNPDYFEFNPKVMKSSANIRYTLDDKWLIVKGWALKNSIDYKQYTRMAKLIMDSDDYMGEEFSMGDLHLAKVANEEEGPGAPSVWNWVGNNHHFEKVLTDIAAMHHAV